MHMIVCHWSLWLNFASRWRGKALWTRTPSRIVSSKQGATLRTRASLGAGTLFPLFLSVVLVGSAHAKLSVVCTTPDIASIAFALTGDLAEIATLAKPTEDPHFVDAKPSFILKLNKADVLLEGGAELESGWLGPLLVSARNPKLAAGSPGRVSCAAGIELLDVPKTLDRSQGDVHSKGNPHYLVDPTNASRVARTIAGALSRVDPMNAAFYETRLELFKTRLESKVAEWERALAPYEGQQLVAHHNTWQYFARRFGLKSELFLEPKPGIPPTPTHLAGVVAKMKAAHVRVIVVEPYQSRKTAERVAAQVGAVRVVDVAQYPGGVKGTEMDYVGLMEQLVKLFAQGLSRPGEPR